ncbi:hypothetical protein BB560_006585, partial [Smittium megazygosporum]
ISSNKLASQVNHSKIYVQQLRTEIKTISSVVNRKLDAATKEYEEKSSQLGIQKTHFKIRANIFLIAVVYITRAIILFNYYRTPVFHIPDAWFSPFTSLLSYPGAPKGTLSIAMWVFVSGKVSSLLINSFEKTFPIPVKQKA